jgi:stearoyl-CoA desaturase (Delta-9 desaturase)
LSTTQDSTSDRGKGNLVGEAPTRLMVAAVWLFVTVPFAALLCAVPFAWAWGWGPSWLDAVMGIALYYIGLSGIGVGFHRHFTHGSFAATRGLRIGMAIAGSLAIEGNIIQWVADHRRHHRFTDQEEDPHSPWRYGESVWGLTKGLFHAHVGWLLKRELSNRERFAKDLLKDKDIRAIDRLFPVFVVLSLLIPVAIAGAVTGSWQGMLLAFFWAGLVRVAVLHHVTWSINSICHVFGERPFATRDDDRAANFWPLAIISGGESWHNLHHADPTCARHGVLRGQLDSNARIIWLFEKLGWATSVRWPKKDKLEKLRVDAARTTA